MYVCHLDMAIYHEPLMNPDGYGILFTRTIGLPFPPYPGLHLFGTEIDDYPEPEGIEIHKVVWDTNRNVFLVDLRHVGVGLPIACIGDDLANWVRLGWSLGSYSDFYDQDKPEPGQKKGTKKTARFTACDLDNNETLAALDPAERPREFNTYLKALVRAMAELYNNLPIAYAIDKTERFITEKDSKSCSTQVVEEWDAAVREYDRIGTDDVWKWREKVCRYPALETVIPIDAS